MYVSDQHSLIQVNFRHVFSLQFVILSVYWKQIFCVNDLVNLVVHYYIFMCFNLQSISHVLWEFCLYEKIHFYFLLNKMWRATSKLLMCHGICILHKNWREAREQEKKGRTFTRIKVYGNADWENVRSFTDNNSRGKRETGKHEKCKAIRRFRLFELAAWIKE